MTADIAQRRAAGRSAPDASPAPGPKRTPAEPWAWVGILPQPALLLDRQGRCLLANTAWARESGFHPDRLTGAGWLDSLAPEDREPIAFRLEQEGVSPDPQPIIREAQWTGGTVVLLNISPFPRPDAEPDQAAWMVIATVISTGAADLAGPTGTASESAQSHDELRMALLAAESAKRSRDRFLAMVSHELRTPLTPALVTLTQVLRELRSREGQNVLVRELDLVRRSIELEARLIDDLLDLTRIARGRMRLTCRSLDLHEALRDVIRLIRPRVDAAGLRLELALEAASPRIIGDETRLRQVLWNLLTNAIVYNRPGGSIRLTSANPVENVVQIEVTDTGMGFEAQELPGLFLPFEQVQSRPRNREGGLGLGLTISKGLVDLHGGNLHARSAGPGEGATFTVELPTADAPSNAALRPGGPCSSQTEVEGRSLDILLIDDHPDTLRAMRRLLQKLGHRVTVAATVKGAREVVATRGEPFDLLISDIGLPDGSGHDIPPMLVKAFPAQPIPAIALSGYGMESDLQASKTAGFARHLVKPISLDQLQDVIGEVTRI